MPVSVFVCLFACLPVLGSKIGALIAMLTSELFPQLSIYIFELSIIKYLIKLSIYLSINSWAGELV